MSHEQPPIRSRRELRKARDAQQAAAAGNTAHDDGQAPPAPGRPAARARTAPEPAAPAERAEPAAALVASAAPAAPAQPVASAAPAASATPAAPAVPEEPAAPAAPAAPAEPVASAASSGPARVRQAPAERSSQARARDRAALRAIKEMEEKESQLSAGGPLTRRQLRLQQLKEQALTGLNTVVPPAGTDVRPAEAAKDSAARQGAGAGPEPQGMTVEQALAARSLIAEQARNQIAKMEHIASLDPEAVDPDILAEQIALAERAAVMNRRAMARQKLAEQASVPPQPRDAAAKERQAPSTATNLAMVTPLQFVQVPGVDRPVMQPPATSYVPVTTHQGTKVPAREGSRPVAPDSEPGAGTAQRPPVRAAGASGAKRSHMIARAEAAARAAGGAQPARQRPARRPVAQEQPAVAARPVQHVAPEPLADDLFEDVPRVPAASAYGLEPLDAATAGLARANRNRMLQIFVLALGIVALVAGIILIISGFSG